ncbi:MAG: helix-turn-helix domain-containing protein [Acidimicrobiia bacterium]|nr:helix-turn-helix domain-containing protein [Acidimicrobiia bacterium]
MSESQPKSEYLTPGEVARLLHVSPKTVNRWAHEGRIACIVTLGGHRRFQRDEVERIASQMASGAPG